MNTFLVLHIPGYIYQKHAVQGSAKSLYQGLLTQQTGVSQCNCHFRGLSHSILMIQLKSGKIGITPSPKY